MKLKESTLQTAFLKDSLTERLAKGLFLLCAFAVIFVTLLITIFLFKEGIPALIQVPLWEIFSGTVWQPSAQVPKFGILPLVTGSTVITVTTLILATPIGVGIALYLSEFSHPLEREVLKPLVELLAAIPSVVFGFFAAHCSERLDTWPLSHGDEAKCPEWDPCPQLDGASDNSEYLRRRPELRA